ncbi:unnamed protein product [Mytilus coruscus]|uniref:Receptor ligand binding region domain-containing protein n=1 Tax=Mytilus coruscus TaxID=42192 RepID=A0A6J7ZXW2_MYTCO|nr:unnamed protein product [Mytilus coruscus]
MLLVFVPFILHIVCVLSANVSITVFAPKNPTKRLFALERVQPAVEIAIDHVMTDKLRGHAINVEYVNSNASDVDSPVAAFKFMSKGVHLFIGPVYDFGVAPVARYAPKWNIPVISPGAFAHSLNQKRSFQTLTRVHTTFNSMAEFFYMILQHFGWTKIKAVSDRFGRNDIFIDFCDLAISSIHQMVIINKDKRYVDYEKYEILREQKDRMTRHVLDKINTKFAGKLDVF